MHKSFNPTYGKLLFVNVTKYVRIIKGFIQDMNILFARPTQLQVHHLTYLTLQRDFSNEFVCLCESSFFRRFLFFSSFFELTFQCLLRRPLSSTPLRTHISHDSITLCGSRFSLGNNIFIMCYLDLVYHILLLKKKYLFE